METLQNGRKRSRDKHKTSLGQKALELHKRLRGKIEVRSKVSARTPQEISIVYTPGVAEVCLEIAADRQKAYEYTNKWNNVAIVTDGTSTLGLGSLGPEAALPVMEGKAVLYKQFGNVDAFPICLETTDADEIVNTVKNIAPVFGGINIEDIETPKVLEIVDRLTEELDIPVFHDDQHGTAVVTLAALLNALKIVGKRPEDVKIVVTGTGAAGIAVTKILLAAGFRTIIGCDRSGAIYAGRTGLDRVKTEFAELTNPEGERGSADEVLSGADV